LRFFERIADPPGGKAALVTPLFLESEMGGVVPDHFRTSEPREYGGIIPLVGPGQGPWPPEVIPTAP